jgi:hypothetical protein
METHALARLRLLLHIMPNSEKITNPPIIADKIMPAPAARLYHLFF